MPPSPCRRSLFRRVVEVEASTMRTHSKGPRCALGGWHANEIARVAIHLVVLVASLALQDGRLCHVASACAGVAAIAIQLMGSPRFLRLNMFWELAFVVVVNREGYFDASELIAATGQDAFDIASRYVCACNAALLLAHLFVFRESGVQAPRNPRSFRAREPATAIVLGACCALFLYFSIPVALQLATGGRV